MISTSFITGGGFMKCMPITRSGRVTEAPMAVMLIDEVLVASMIPAAAGPVERCEDLPLRRRSSRSPPR